MTVKAILTDIEGTTSSIAFVFEVLFPYAKQHLPDYVRSCAKTIHCPPYYKRYVMRLKSRRPM